VAVEFDSDAVTTLEANTSWPVIAEDIHDVTSDAILTRAGLRVGDADLLVGGPPCQPFSKSGYWASGDTRRLDDPRASTLEQFLRVLRDTLPKTFLIENVPGMGYKGKDEGLDFLRRWIDTINEQVGTRYSVSRQIINAVDHGVPQERERLFLVGHREGRDFQFPAPTHARYDPDSAARLALDDLEPCRTAWDALADIEEDAGDPELALTGKWADLVPSIPEGANYLYHTDRGDGLPLFGWRRRFWHFLLKLAKDRPSWTITAQPGPATGPFHWGNRRLSRTELRRLQTFPEEFQILGDLRSAQKQLGNAVPSALAEVLGHAIRAQLLDEAHVPPKHTSLVPNRQTPVPPPTEVQSVPEQYLDRVGDHEAHPGTGGGYGALARSKG